MLELVEITKGLAGELIIVILFLWYLHSRDKIYDTRLMAMTKLFTDTAKEGHEVAGKLAEALGELRIEIARSNGKAAEK